MIGSKLWHDFSSEDKFDESMINTIKELGNRGKSNISLTNEIISERDLKITTNSKNNISLDIISKWTTEQVGEWLKSNNLQQYQSLFLKNNINGIALLQFASYTKEGINFLMFLEKSLEISSLGDRLILIDALNKLK